MTRPLQPATFEQPATRAEQTAERLVAEILSGRLAPGDQVSPERELAATLGVSRATLREAQGRLQSMGLVVAQRGSGTRVADWRREGRLELIPYLLRYGAGQLDLLRFFGSLLRLRRTLLAEGVRWLAVRDGVDWSRLDGLRREAHARRGLPEFVEADLALVRGVFEASDFLPGVWLLNQFADIYRQVTASLPEPPLVPADYGERWDETLRAARAGDAAAAEAELLAYLHDHDRLLIPDL